MTATIASGAPRQSAILVAVAGLHVGAIILFASGTLRQALDLLPAPPELVLVRRVPEPVEQLRPGLPALADYVPQRAPLPDIDFPPALDETPSIAAVSVAVDPAAGADSGSRGSDFQPPALRMHDKRLAALVDDCYPAAARRMGEEGRAIARIVVGADGRAASWTPMLGSGFPRLDAALGCVIRRLQFLPGRRDGGAVAAEVQLPIVFRLH
jgi:protein TonB